MVQSRRRMKAIGGYPELELRKGEHYHKEALRLNTARNCLEYILLARGHKKVYVPYYTCEAVLEPLKKNGIFSNMVLYHINEQLDPVELPELKEGEAFLYTNYFGLKQETVERFASIYGNRLIVDNSQAFYDMPCPGIDTFYSARKFFGVADGAYLYTDKFLESYNGSEIEPDISYDRMRALLKRVDLGAEEGYHDFQEIESSLCNQSIRRMSKLTEAIMASIDFENIKERRIANFKHLHESLRHTNKLSIPDIGSFECPMVYPYLTDDTDLQKKLIDNKIFVATYWPNVFSWGGKDSTEYQLAKDLIPLPIDQRYGEEDMYKIINIILQQ